MANLDNRKINLRHLLIHPRDKYDSIHFNLLVGNYKYMIDEKENLVRYDAKKYQYRARTKNYDYYGASSSFHFTFRFHSDDLDAVSEICKSTNMAVIHRNKSEEVNLFSRIKLKCFPKHVLPFDLAIKSMYCISSMEDLETSVKTFKSYADEKDLYKRFTSVEEKKK
jgi:hypothetical protein